MKILLLFLLVSLTMSCSKNENQDFSCSLDYVELIDNSFATIKFDISLNAKKESFILNENYTFSNDIYSVGG
jgi:hypothetical protein|tara:strand:- start:307 stop:522 length:216 start_codon:yes stop_codon:yes gene_type:complete